MKPLGLVDLTLTYVQAFGALVALNLMSSQAFPVKTAIKIRKLQRELLPYAEDLEKIQNQIIKDYGAEVEEGTGRILRWQNEKGRSELGTIQNEVVTISCVPLLIEEIESAGAMVTPAALANLEDAGLLVEGTPK